MQTRPDLTGLEILIIEDELLLARGLERLLNRAAAEVTIAPTLAQARVLLDSGRRWDVALLDQKLPDGDGLELIEEYVERGLPQSIVATSANLQESKRALTLQSLGAVLLPKPFDEPDLFRAIAAALVAPGERTAGVFAPQRDSGEFLATLEFGGIAVGLVTQTVSVEGVSVDLQPTQFRILAHMLANSGRVVPVVELTHVALKGSHFDGGANIRFQIHSLRRRLGEAGKLIETSAGGYGVGLARGGVSKS